MKPDFISEAHRVWSSVVKNELTDSYDLKLQLEIHKKLLNIFQVGSYYYFIFNLAEKKFDFLSEGIQKVLEYCPKETTANFLLSNIHPDDQPFFIHFEKAIIEFYNKLTIDKIPLYKIQYDYRIKDKSGNYKRILHQAVLIQFDEKKNYYRSLGLHTDISHLKKEGIPVLSIIGLENEPSFINTQATQFSNQPFGLFTKREKEILKCIVEGKQSKEIARELFISLHTVNTHRKKILNKANLKSPLDLAVKAINEGWI